MITAREFEAYLEPFAPDEVIGEAGNARRCPLALAMTALEGRQVWVFASHVSYEGTVGAAGAAEYPVASWAAEFVMTLDRYDFEAEGDAFLRDGTPVTAHQVRLALEEALRLVALDVQVDVLPRLQPGDS